MLRLLASILLLPTAAAAFDLSIGAGRSVSTDDSRPELHDTTITQLSTRLHFADHWGLGIEGLYRLNDYKPSAFSSANYDAVTKSLGIELSYAHRFLGRHRVGVAGSAGTSRLRNDSTDYCCEAKGRYRAISAFYDLLPTEHFSIGLSIRRQTDRLEFKTSQGNLNTTGLSNIVFNPYVRSEVTYKGHLEALSLNIGYRF